NRASVDVELRLVNAQTVAAIDDLHGEGFVQLPEINVINLQPVALQQFRYGEDRADAHLVGLAAGDGESAEDHQWFDAEFFRRVPRHQQCGRSAVGEL